MTTETGRKRLSLTTLRYGGLAILGGGVAATLALALSGGAGAATAGGVSGSSVIAACVNVHAKPFGYVPWRGVWQLYTAKVPSCPKGSFLVTWNQQGPPGPQGYRGPAGPPGVVTTIMKEIGPFTLNPGDQVTETVSCGPDLVTGGGYELIGTVSEGPRQGGTNLQVLKDAPAAVPGGSGNVSGWTVTVVNLPQQAPTTLSFKAYAVCAVPGS